MKTFFGIFIGLLIGVLIFIFLDFDSPNSKNELDVAKIEIEKPIFKPDEVGKKIVFSENINNKTINKPISHGVTITLTQTGTSSSFRYSDVGSESKEDIMEYNKYFNNNFCWPTASHRVSCGYESPTHPFRKLLGEHRAVDIGCPQGSDIYAAEAGRVEVNWRPTTNYAKITIHHGSGYKTVYGHISWPKVYNGQEVRRGEVIGLSGGEPHSIGAGSYTTGPHLHFEAFFMGKHISPTYLFKGNAY
jgi:murein DD-endopeptidase MepM/ murein hydrolase activator NlpD